MHTSPFISKQKEWKRKLLRVTLIKRRHVTYPHEQYPHGNLHQWHFEKKKKPNLCCNTQNPLACPICCLPTCTLWTVRNVYLGEETLHKYSPLSEGWRCFNVMSKSWWSLSSLFRVKWRSLAVLSCEEFRCQSKTFSTLDQLTRKSWFCREKLLPTVHPSEMDSLWFIQWLPNNKNKKETSEDQTVGRIFWITLKIGKENKLQYLCLWGKLSDICVVEFHMRKAVLFLF